MTGEPEPPRPELWNDVPTLFAEAAESSGVLWKLAEGFESVGDDVILEWLQPTQGEAAIEADADLVGRIGSAAMENIPSVEKRAASRHDGLSRLFG